MLRWVVAFLALGPAAAFLPVTPAPTRAQISMKAQGGEVSRRGLLDSAAKFTAGMGLLGAVAGKAKEEGFRERGGLPYPSTKEAVAL